MMRVGSVFVLASVMLVGGCKSRYVEATVHNGTAAAVSVVEVDYPSASFGKETLAAGADFHYRFKVQGDGALKLSYTDAAQKEYTASGPVLHEGDEGTLRVTIAEPKAGWELKVSQK